MGQRWSLHSQTEASIAVDSPFLNGRFQRRGGLGDYKIKAFETWHYMALNDAIEQDRGLTATLSMQAQRIARDFRERGVGRSLFYKDSVIACGGVMTAWPGLGFTWAVISPMARQRPHMLVMHYMVQEYLEDYIVMFNYRRIEANVNANFVIGQKWVQRLGFVKESEMPCFGPNGEDFIKYVIVRRT